ncbi:MAG: MinD/ParA family protein [Deltaproteobacteria bacterium]|nr:MinD/ParA family protein [Deltaproteobacteria bacterium]
MTQQGSGFRLWAVGGGKGGTGRSIVSCNLALALAERDLEVVLVDGDLGGACLHHLLGIQAPQYTLNDLIVPHGAGLEELLLPTVHPRLKLLAGASGRLGLAEADGLDRAMLGQKLVRLDADVILLDLGPGTSLATLDLWNMAGNPLLLTTPEPTAVQGAYTFLQLALQRRIQLACSAVLAVSAQLGGPGGLLARWHGQPISGLIQEIAGIDSAAAQAAETAAASLQPKLVLNAADRIAAARTAGTLAGAAHFFLGLDLVWVGSVPEDAELRSSVRLLEPFLIGCARESPTAAALRELALILLRNERVDPGPADGRQLRREVELRPPRQSPPPPSVSVEQRSDTAPWVGGPHEITRPIPGMQGTRAEDLRVGGRVLHLQTEDLGPVAAEVLTVVYEQGRILLARRSSYASFRHAPDIGARVHELVLRQHEQVRAELPAATKVVDAPQEGSP